ncbi:MAG: hypothetical protein IT580_24920, partial [Verrucomicrobiales bacterium]|nr:hypothetical protein [Verrucomicrobiales bacterium]
MNELRFALRQLGQRPTFAAVIILTLALGIGATTAMFTAAQALLFHPLPWREAHRVVSLWEGNPTKNLLQAPMAAAQFLDLRRDARSFEALATWYPAAVNLAAEGATPERHAGALVSQDFFAVIGVAPAL